ncbi:hypothetical protein AB0873_27165 [Micromonospora sp. NPDC047707]|uniref:hypothetical protein n=1 Tax=Micromonospora sp. NPDC047707 TaxID=3154498 RepID=UPI003454B551
MAHGGFDLAGPLPSPDSALLGDGLRRFKAGPLEAEWETVAEEARVSIREVATVEAVPGYPTESKIRYDLETARSMVHLPALSASFVRLALERALTALLPPDYVDRAYTLKHLLLAAREVGAMSGGAFIVGERVVMLASRGAHGHTTPVQVMELVDLAEDFIALLPLPDEERLPSRLPSTRPPGERAAARPATSSGP